MHDVLSAALEWPFVVLYLEEFFAESYPNQTRQQAPDSTPQRPQLPYTPFPMSTFLQIASRVEAAVAAYISVRDFADEEKWRAQFKQECVSV